MGSDSMFTRLIQEASEDVEKDRVAMVTPTKAAAAREPKGPVDPGGILELLTEYLFDLFDANCTEDFKKMEAFEKRAVLAFDPDDEEYTLAQTELHTEFQQLFEALTGTFLKTEGYTCEQVYAIAEKAMKIGDGSSLQAMQASEVHDVIMAVVNFENWASEMKSIAARQRAYS